MISPFLKGNHHLQSGSIFQSAMLVYRSVVFGGVSPRQKRSRKKKHRSENADFEIPLNVIGGLPEYFLETCCCLHPESSSQHIHPSIQKCIRCWQRKLGMLPSFPTFLGVTVNYPSKMRSLRPATPQEHIKNLRLAQTKVSFFYCILTEDNPI